MRASCDDDPTELRWGPAQWTEVCALAKAHGLPRLGLTTVDHPGFAHAAESLGRFVAAGYAGTMDFMVRTLETRQRPGALLDGARSLIVGLVPHGGASGPIARYAQHEDYHVAIAARLRDLCEAIATKWPAFRAVVGVDAKPVMERAAAVCAGLGSLGKNGCLIAPGLGSYVLIGVAVTNVGWSGPGFGSATNAQPTEVCGSCRACLEACPTQAFVAPGLLDARRCVSYLTIERREPIAEDLAAGLGERVFGCDACQEVCPHNTGPSRDGRARSTAGLRPWDTPAGMADEASAGELVAEELAAVPDRNGAPAVPRDLSLVALSQLRGGAYRRFIAGTPMNRTPARHLRRNALLALGNRDGPLEEEERAAVEAAETDGFDQARAAAMRVRSRRGG